ncbi:OmpA family protein [Acuticoccus sp. M5D2P5]|uniref:OmpA family protein n=1 Tax=Acuticoccus kalidii TaxID=2910977 RepID=UPI001F423A45|nr:OmpA family protein [Acuticoccus kalidii]MCF3935783.1 OmpA family protein [Acuticoccus kalidii]
MMKHLAGALAGVALVGVMATAADAQSRLTRNEIVNSLQRTEGTVGAFDPMALQREAERAAAMGGDNAPGPVSDRLTRLPQLSVEINFDLNSARIRPESYYSVGLIADALHTPALMGQRLLVVGHTDASGPREFNLELSKKRAASVAAALTTTFNVPASEVISIGLGEEQLQDFANPYDAINRRVQIINLGP